jgi:ribosome-binding protein aMBF1 (putative translation factor)
VPDVGVEGEISRFLRRYAPIRPVRMGTTAHDVLRSLAANVRAIRRRRGLTQDRLAELAKLDLRQVQRAESGRVDVGLLTLSALAAALDVAPGRLLRSATLEPPRLGRPPRATKAGG